jgi:beta-phosphoglucomutase-like phosphatase (HAD superfamily)
MNLLKYFKAFVTEEDGMESIAHRFLSAAVKLDRPPAKCVVFEDDPRGIAAAHNCTMKAVALIGSHPAYELTQSDLAVSSFADLSVMNLRRLFANKGAEFMDLQKQPEEKKPAKRRLMMDTWF